MKSDGVAKSKPASKKEILCIYHAQGKCNKGKYCEYSHAGGVSFAAVARIRSPPSLGKDLPATKSTSTDWILDTGTGNDLCPRGTPGRRVNKDSMMALETANGIVQPDASVTVSIDALNEDAECVELAQTVTALSIGRRCVEHGYGFE